MERAGGSFVRFTPNIKGLRKLCRSFRKVRFEEAKKLDTNDIDLQGLKIGTWITP